MATNRKNLASGILANSPGTSGTSFVLETGYGQTMPDVPFHMTTTPPGQLSTLGNSEIVEVTARTGDTLTVTRAQRGTTAKDVQSGWPIVNGIYVEDEIPVSNVDLTTFYAAHALASENGWNRYINPANGKIRYWRSGTTSGASGNAGGFQYINTGINFPAGTRLVSATVRSQDQAVSITPRTINNVSFVAQTFFSPVTPQANWYYELEEL